MERECVRDSGRVEQVWVERRRLLGCQGDEQSPKYDLKITAAPPRRQIATIITVHGNCVTLEELHSGFRCTVLKWP